MFVYKKSKMLTSLLAATIDCYLNDAADFPNLDQGRAEVGLFMTTLREINNLESEIFLHGYYLGNYHSSSF